MVGNEQRCCPQGGRLSWRTAIIGLGQIGLQTDLGLDSGAYVYSHARAFASHPEFQLVAGVDASATHRDLFSKHYHVPALASIGPELALLAPDVIAIAVPTVAHAQVMDEVLNHCRPKAILCEKPLSYEAIAAQGMVERCERIDASLYVNYIRRADPAVTEVKARLLDGRIHTPVKGVAWYSKGVFNNGSHFIDLLQYWLGPVRNHAVLNPGRKLGPDFEPDFRLQFDAGEVVFLAAREEDYSHYTIELVAPNGRLRYDCGGEEVRWQGTVSSATAPGYVVLDPTPESIPGDLDRIQWHIADQLAVALRGDSSSLCQAREALRLVETIHSICKNL